MKKPRNEIGLLVLGRKPGEKITLRSASGEVIEVAVVRITPNAVRIGIAASQSWNVIRNELLDRYPLPIQAGPEQVSELGVK